MSQAKEIEFSNKIRGYWDAVNTINGLSSYEDRQVAIEWLNTEEGKEVERLVQRIEAIKAEAEKVQ